MSIFEESWRVFSDPLSVLKVIVVDEPLPELDRWTWSDVGAYLSRSPQETSPLSSSWSRVEKLYSFQKLMSKYPQLATEDSSAETRCVPPQSVLDRCGLVQLEMSMDCQLPRSDFLNACKFSLPHIDLHSLDAYSSSISAFPLLNFAARLQRTPGPDRLSVLVLSGVTVGDIPRFPLEIRTIIRDTLASSTSLPDRASMELCERYDQLACLKLGPKLIRKPFSICRKILHVIASLESDRASDLTRKIPQVPAGVDTEQLRQRALLLNAHQVVVRPVGRGACLLNSDTESGGLINLTGKFGDVGVVSLDSSVLPMEALIWPEFHNGTAQAFSQSTVSRDLILVHRNKSDQLARKKNLSSESLAIYRHAGYLFGSLMRGAHFRPDEIYRYLKQQNECVSIGVILGSAIARNRSREIAKLCFLHIPGQLLTTPESEIIDISLPIQSAAIAGLGFVYAQSKNRSVIESIFSEFQRKPIGDKSFSDRECLALSCGIGIGLISLGAGPDLPTDLGLADRFVDLMDDRKQRFLQEASSDNSARVSLLFEPASVNVSVTLPGACIGLGLAYLDTCDICVSDRVRIPSTFEELEKSQSRPDCLMFKYIAKWLINLSSVSYSTEYMLNQLPGFLRDPIGVLENRERRQAGSETPSSVDWLAVVQARMYALTGMCLVLGVKHAGCRDPEVKKSLIKILTQFIEELSWPSSHCAAQSASRPSMSVNICDRITIETCRAALVLSLSVLMSGSGDAECVKLIRCVSERMDEATHHGVRLAVNMATGFLFLGVGRQSFKRDPFSMACLLISVIPRYSSSVSDQRMYLQALRHLYVLACEESTTSTVDIGTLAETKQDERHYINGTGEYVQRKLGVLPKDIDPLGTLNSDRAYVSEYGEPSRCEVRRLIGVPLSEDNCQEPLSWFKHCSLPPTSRIDWRLTPAELAAVSFPSESVQARLNEMRQSRDALVNVEPIQLSLAEKYCHLLHAGNRNMFIRTMTECVKEGRLDTYLDKLEAHLAS